jgi:hypothetical protein
MGHLLTFSIIHRTRLLRIAVSTSGQAQLLPAATLSAPLAQGSVSHRPYSVYQFVRW